MIHASALSSEIVSKAFTIRKLAFYNDEPKIFQYVADVRSARAESETVRGYGSDFNKEAAMIKAVCEAVERKSLGDRADHQLIKSNTAGLNHPFISPARLRHFTPHQLKSKKISEMQEDSEYLWVSGSNVTSNELTFVPAQAVFFPYQIDDEPLLRFPSTSGAACGDSVLEACSKAVLELIERDAFMCWYFAAIPARKINIDCGDFDAGDELENIIATFRRYKLELNLMLLPSQWSDHPIVFAVIVDTTGIGPTLTTGLKCHPCLRAAIKGAIVEAQQKRPWLRDYMYLHGLPTFRGKNAIQNSWSRACFWSLPDQHKRISFLWQEAEPFRWDNTTMKVNSIKDIDWDEIWKLIITAAINENLDLIVFELGGDLNKLIGTHTIKAVIPQMHPIYMDERFRYLSSESLKRAMRVFGSRRFDKAGHMSEFDAPPHCFW